VHSISVYGEAKRYIVIDQQRRCVAPTQRKQGFGLFQPFCCVGEFVAVLQQSHTCTQSSFRSLQQQISREQAFVSYRVQPAQ
jgi:hypothetical protein